MSSGRNDYYSAQEYGNMLICYGEACGNASEALRIYINRYPGVRHPIDSRVIIRAYQRVLDNQPIVPQREGVGKPVRASVENHILSVVRQNPGLGVRTTARVVHNRYKTRVSHSTVHRVLRRDHQPPRDVDLNKPGTSQASGAQFDAEPDIENILGRDANQSSTSDNVIHVFCPKCNTEVPHSAEGIQQDQTKILITKVYRYFEQEYEELKKMYKDVDLTPLSKFRQRTSLATGVSDSMLKQILREDERRREAVDRARAVKRRKDSDSLIDEDSSDDNDDDLDAVADAAADVQEPEQSYDETETLVVKIEQPTEFNNDEPEIFVPAPVKVEPGDYEHNNKQVQADPISLDIKTEPQDEAETTIETQDLNEPTTSKRKARKRPKITQDTSTQQSTLGVSSIATTSRNILWAALEQSNLLDETVFTTEETHEEEGFS